MLALLKRRNAILPHSTRPVAPYRLRCHGRQRPAPRKAAELFWMKGTRTRVTGSLTNRLSEAREENAASLDPAEFCQLLLSRKHLSRISQPTDSTNVIVDTTTGKRYEVEAGLLNRYI